MLFIFLVLNIIQSRGVITQINKGSGWRGTLTKSVFNYLASSDLFFLSFIFLPISPLPHPKMRPGKDSQRF